MSTLLVDRIAQHIRLVDGGNTMFPRRLGIELALFIDAEAAHCEGCQSLVADFVAKVNPDKTMGAGRLADLIVAEFRLDEED